MFCIGLCNRATPSSFEFGWCVTNYKLWTILVKWKLNFPVKFNFFTNCLWISAPYRLHVILWTNYFLQALGFLTNIKKKEKKYFQGSFWQNLIFHYFILYVIIFMSCYSDFRHKTFRIRAFKTTFILESFVYVLCLFYVFFLLQ